MVQVKISETYDLSTKIGKMGIVGIHTPTGALIDKMWPGLVMNCKKFRFVSCDVAMACASMLPADPLQVGVEAGSIAPEDLFNPILYKAVSNDSLTNILSTIMKAPTDTGDTPPAVVDQGSIVDMHDTALSTGAVAGDQFAIYYGLLSGSSHWRKAMPQVGLEMRGLYPIVYQVISQYGQNVYSGSTAWPEKGGVGDLGDTLPIGCNGQNTEIWPSTNYQNVSGFGMNMVYRGPSMRMPAIDTIQLGGLVPAADGNDTNPKSVGTNIAFPLTGKVPPAYVGLIVLPPAKLNQLYYRLRVEWTIEFTGLRPYTDIASYSYLEQVGNIGYGTDYAEQSTAMTTLTSMVDTAGADVKKIMEGV